MSYHSPSITDPTLTADALDKTVAEFDTVEDLLKHFNPVSWQDDLENLYLDTPHYRGRSYHDRKSKGKKQSLECSSSLSKGVYRKNKRLSYNLLN